MARGVPGSAGGNCAPHSYHRVCCYKQGGALCLQSGLRRRRLGLLDNASARHRTERRRDRARPTSGLRRRGRRWSSALTPPIPELSESSTRHWRFGTKISDWHLPRSSGAVPQLKEHMWTAEDHHVVRGLRALRASSMITVQTA